MKPSHWNYLIAAILLATRVSAAEVCADAQKIEHLPESVRAFVSQRDGCDHWRGEPSDFDESYLRQAGEAGLVEQRKRYEEIQRNVAMLCKGTDKRLAHLKRQYADSRPITEFLNGYEKTIEPGLTYTQSGFQAERP